MRVRYRQHRSSCREGRPAAHRAGALCPLAVGAPHLAPWAGGTCGCATSLGVPLSVLTRRDRASGLTLRGFELVLPLPRPGAVLELQSFSRLSTAVSCGPQLSRPNRNRTKRHRKAEYAYEASLSILHSTWNPRTLQASRQTEMYQSKCRSLAADIQDLPRWVQHL